MPATRISALIPDKSQPPQIIVDQEGRLPTFERKDKETPEDTLRRMGHYIISSGQYLSVDYARFNIADYEYVLQAKSISQVALREGFEWVELPEGLRLAKPLEK